MSVKDTIKQYSAIDTAPAPVTVPNDVSRSLPPGDRSFADVVFQSGKPVLDCELNLQQDVQTFADALVSKHGQQSGIFRGQTRNNAYDDFSFDTPPTVPVNGFIMKRVEAIVAGFPLVIEYTNTPNDGENLIQLDAPTTFVIGDPTTIKRTDFVFLEVWQALVAPSPQAQATVALNSVVAGDTLQFAWAGPTTFTAVAIPAAPTDFAVGIDDTATAANLVVAINTVLAGQVAAVAAGNYVLIYITDPALAGAAGNGLVLAGAGGFPLLTLTAGGADRPNKPSQTQLYRHGNVLSDTATWLPDDLMDPSLHAETAQRVQIQYRIRVTGAAEAVDYKVNPDGFSTTTVLAQGGAAAPVANYQFVPADGLTVKGNSNATAYGIVDNGLYIAGDGSSVSAQDLGSLDGYVYAIPLCFVFRHNNIDGVAGAEGFDPKNNTNGAPTYNHINYTNTLIDPLGPGLLVNNNESDRPDGHFCDIIDPDNLLDLRRHVNPMGVDLNAELQYQIQSLMDGKNFTWAIDTADKQVLGNGSGDVSVRHLVCDNVGREDSIDGTTDYQGNTPRGVTIRNFDHICRRFGDQPVAERVIVAFYPHDSAAGAGADGFYVDAPVVILNSAAASNPILFTTAAAHLYQVGDYIEIVGHSIAAVNRKWVVSSVPAANQFTVSYDNTAGPAGAGGNAYGVGVTNPGKYVNKAVGVGSPYRWHEDDELVLDLSLFDATSDGGIFDGKTWISSGAGLASTAFTTFAPPGTVITDVLSVFHDDGYFGPSIAQNVQLKGIAGLGTTQVTLTLDGNNTVANSGLTSDNAVASPTYNPDHDLSSTAVVGDRINGSERRIYVEFEITYPRGENGTTNTPDEPLTPNSNAVYPFGIPTSRNRAVVENNSTARPFDWNSLAGALYRDGHREVQLEYQVGEPLVAPVPPIVTTTRLFDEVVSVNLNELVMPRRISDSRTGIAVTELSTPAARTVDTTLTPYGSSTRRIILDGATLLPQRQTRCDVRYYSLDAIPNYGATTTAYQLSLYYRSNAPQTCGIHNGDFINTLAGGQLPPTLTIEPMVTSTMLYSGQLGMGSVEDGFPYAAPLDQIPINDGTPYIAPLPPTPPGKGVAREWIISGTASISIADFNAATGLLNLPTYVAQDGSTRLTLGGTSTAPVVQRPVADAEFRIFYPFSDPNTYRPTVMAEALTGPVTHKVFIPFLARALFDSGSFAARNTTGQDGILFRKNEILLVVLTRFATIDANNNIVFQNQDTDTTCAAVYRTRNLLLTVGE